MVAREESEAELEEVTRSYQATKRQRQQDFDRLQAQEKNDQEEYEKRLSELKRRRTE